MSCAYIPSAQASFLVAETATPGRPGAGREAITRRSPAMPVSDERGVCRATGV